MKRGVGDVCKSVGEDVEGGLEGVEKCRRRRGGGK